MTLFTSGGGSSRSEPSGRRPAAGASGDPAVAMLRGALVPSAVVGAATTALSALAGSGAAAGAATGAVLVLAASAVAPMIMSRVREASPPAVMAAALLGYLVLVVALGVVYALLEPAGWLSQFHVGVALLTGTVAATVGQLRAAARLRLPVFGDPPQGAPDPPTPSGRPGGDAVQSPTRGVEAGGDPATTTRGD